jgi:hypothetical protein
MKVIDYVESTPYADVMKVQLTLAREWYYGCFSI